MLEPTAVRTVERLDDFEGTLPVHGFLGHLIDRLPLRRKYRDRLSGGNERASTSRMGERASSRRTTEAVEACRPAQLDAVLARARRHRGDGWRSRRERFLAAGQASVKSRPADDRRGDPAAQAKVAASLELLLERAHGGPDSLWHAGEAMSRASSPSTARRYGTARGLPALARFPATVYERRARASRPVQPADEARAEAGLDGRGADPSGARCSPTRRLGEGYRKAWARLRLARRAYF